MTERGGVRPSVNRAEPPDFHRMDSRRFEQMTCSLLDRVKGASEADLYAPIRQRQYGIDAWARYRGGRIVASCKCQERVKKGEVARWTADFLDHWESHWRAEGVKHFILVVAAPMHSQQRIDDIAIARAAFAAVGVEFEIWSPVQLQERLRDQPGIVSQYLEQYWVEVLCGGRQVDAAVEAVVRTSPADANVGAELDLLAQALSGEVEAKITRARVELEKGNVEAVETTLKDLKASATWPRLGVKVQAQAVRLQASLALERGLLDLAEQLAAEAAGLASADEPRLEAVIASHRHGPEAALAALGEPVSAAGRKLRVSLWLQLERFDDADRELADLAEDSETQRLKTLRHLLVGDATVALEHALRALQLDDQRTIVCRVAAVAHYASALSPRIGAAYMCHPHPIGRNFVRGDARSVAALERAAELFSLSAERDPDPLGAEHDRVWRLACLSNLEGRIGEAEALCASILDASPMNVFAIGWAMSRNLQFDRDRSLAALRAALLEGSLPESAVRALEWLWPDDDAEGLKAAFNEALSRAPPLPDDVAGEIRAGLERLDGKGDAADGARYFAIVERARESGNWDEPVALFEEVAARESFQPGFIYLAEDLASAERWDVLYHHRSALLAFETPATTRLVVYAAINTGNVSVALELIEAAKVAEAMSFDLRRAEAAALLMAGQAPLALERAAALAAETAEPADRLMEAQLRAQIGDLSGAAPAVRKALQTGEFDPSVKLHWANRMASAEPELARMLWREAVAAKLGQEASIAALGLSFKLGVEHERPQLFHVLGQAAAAGAPGIEMTSIDELVARVREGREREAHINSLYGRGAAPIHVLIEALNGDLDALYTLNEAPPRRPLFLRHGARPLEIDVGKAISEWRVRMDVTAFLLAAELDLLDTVEALPHPISVAHTLPQILAALEDKVRFHQPSRVEAARAILALVDTGKIEVGPSGAHTIAYEANDEGTSSFGVLLDALVAEGGVDAPRAAVIEGTGQTWKKRFGPPPLRGARVLFPDNTLEALVEPGLLAAVAERFAIVLNEEGLSHYRELDRAGAEGDVRAGRLAARRLRLMTGIETGKYVLLAPFTPEREDDGDEGDHVRSELTTCLFGVLSGATPGDMVWIDDRHVSGYVHADGGLVVGVVEILRALRASALIDEDGYYRRLLKLRSSGALFIPMSEEEVLHHLAAAPLNEGTLVETPALATLRRNFALSVLNESELKIREGDRELAGRPLELAFPLSNRKVADDAIGQVWQNEPDLARARALSDWIYRNLRVEHTPMRGGDETAPFAAITVAGMIAHATFLGELTGEAKLARPRAFMDWLDETVLRPRWNDEAFRGELVRTLRTYLLRTYNGYDGEPPLDFQRDVGPVLRRLVALLPADLQQVLLDEVSFRETLGYPRKGLIVVAGVPLRPGRLWRAARRALLRGKAQLKTASGEFVRLEAAPGARAIQMSGAITGKLTEPGLVLLDRETEENEREALDLLQRCDVPAEERHDLLKGLMALSPLARMRLFQERREGAVVSYIDNLGERLHTETAIPIAQFDPPRVAAWLNFLSVSLDAGGDVDLNVNLDGAIADMGRPEAFKRWTGLPFALNAELYTGAVEGPLGSPMEAIHRIAAARVAGGDPMALGALVDETFEHWREWGALFLSILRWAARHFESRDDWRALPEQARHAVLWTSADQLTRVFIGAGADAEFSVGFFDRLEAPVQMSAALELLAGYDDSALDAGCVRLEPLLIFGLMDALGPEAWSTVMSAERQAKVLELFGADRPDGGKVLRPVRAQVKGKPNWFARGDWKSFAFLGLPDGDQMVVESLALVEQEPANREALVGSIGFGLPKVEAALEARFETAVSNADFQALAENDANLIAIRLLGEACSRLTGAAACGDRFLEKLLQFAQARAASHAADLKNQKVAQQFSLALIEAAASASKSFVAGEGERRVCDFAARLVQICPVSAPIISQIFDAAIQNTTVAKSGPLWRPALTARLL